MRTFGILPNYFSEPAEEKFLPRAPRRKIFPPTALRDFFFFARQGPAKIFFLVGRETSNFFWVGLGLNFFTFAPYYIGCAKVKRLCPAGPLVLKRL